MRRLRDPLLRLGFRVGYRVLRVWWFLRRPTKRGVKCVLTRGDDILLVRHTYGGRKRTWELPGGGVKRREQPPAAARREVREELGVDVPDLEPLGELFARIDRKRDRLWCFAAEVGGRELERDPAEIAEFAWFPRAALPPERARYVERIVALADPGPERAATAPPPASTAAPRPGSRRGRV
jgi:8-oxo-dGTP pyrophosphatase MutT (NUDIX family)